VSTPRVGLLHIDTSRIGGSTAHHRHAFGMAPSLPPQREESEFSAPPPKRVLAQGVPTTPSLTPSQIASIQRNLGSLSEALKLELETVKAEADTVSGNDLGASGDFRVIPVVGTIFNAPEIRNQIVVDSKAISGVAGRILSGSASPYLTDPQRETLETVMADAQALAGYVKQFPVAAPEGRLVAFANEHAEMHVKDAGDMLAAIERNVVSGEAASVPVNEPSGGIPVGGIVAIIALIAVGIVIWEIA